MFSSYLSSLDLSLLLTARAEWCPETSQELTYFSGSNSRRGGPLIFKNIRPETVVMLSEDRSGVIIKFI